MRNFNINGLRIVVEQTGEGPDDYTIPYVGRDGAKADAVMDGATPNWRTLFRPMTGTRRNRPVEATSSAAAVSEAPIESPKESPKSKKTKAQ